MPFTASQAHRQIISAGGQIVFEQSGTSYAGNGATVSLAALPPMPEAVASVRVKALEAGGNPGHGGVLSSQSSVMLQALVELHKGTYSDDSTAITFLKKLGMK